MAHQWTLTLKSIPAGCLILLQIISCIRSISCVRSQSWHDSQDVLGKPRNERRLWSEEVKHPLDPLTSAEYMTVQSVLREASLLGGYKQVLISVDLDDPLKDEVLAWKPGTPIPTRHAEVVMTIDTKPRKIIVDVSGSGRIVENKEIPGSGYPALSEEAENATAYLPATYQPFLDSIAARGIAIDDVYCEAASPGWFNVSAEENRILVYLLCYDTKGTANVYMRPLEGVTIAVDATEMKIIKYLDVLKAPMPTSKGTDYRFAAQKGPFLTFPKPGVIEHPSFTLDGHIVKWAGWEFHVRPNLRSQNVISIVKKDGRSVMYQGFVSEVFVPYQSATTDWYWRTYMDAGEYNLGFLSLPLQPLNDCPRGATFMNATFAAGPDGSPYVTDNLICIFERYAGDIAWRHAEDLPVGDIRESRPKMTLVVRTIASNGNYDYIFDWEFQTDGIIRVKVEATGVLEISANAMKYVNEANMTKAEIDKMYGTLISENTIGVFHDHFFSFHLDMDVDGPNNSFVEGKLVKHLIPPEESLRKSRWGLEKYVAKTEDEARIQINPIEHPAQYYVMNPSKKTRLGNQVSYRLVPGGVAPSLLDPSDYPQIRAGFTKNQVLYVNDMQTDVDTYHQKRCNKLT
ncbi:hypothetical protein M758_5G160400 [Ceratodon purpureus]|nr:hypothetical protein M758_5G160400 [Ceratodon purpureus]KAG0617050.1 hypothetical protein M758_5G160400 [Ceratodon purpureus]KAG0617054.1 hypothetical protein M758_5G160400 [Ceratodon purpureus]